MLCSYYLLFKHSKLSTAANIYCNVTHWHHWALVLENTAKWVVSIFLWALTFQCFTSYLILTIRSSSGSLPRINSRVSTDFFFFFFFGQKSLRTLKYWAHHSSFFSFFFKTFLFFFQKWVHHILDAYTWTDRQIHEESQFFHKSDLVRLSEFASVLSFDFSFYPFFFHFFFLIFLKIQIYLSTFFFNKFQQKIGLVILIRIFISCSCLSTGNKMVLCCASEIMKSPSYYSAHDKCGIGWKYLNFFRVIFLIICYLISIWS